MTTYIAFLRGINVGGNSLIKMAELKEALGEAGLKDVKTYIQSGNVIFKSDNTDTIELAKIIKKTIRNSFGLIVDTAVFSKDEWRGVIESAPKWWGSDALWRHNILIMIDVQDLVEAVESLGQLKGDIEKVIIGKGVIYQSMLITGISRAMSGSRMVSKPIYKKMTIRNYNTATKILKLLNEITD